MDGEHSGCDCIRCRARLAGIGPPPWTPEQWARIDPMPDPAADDPVKTDPDVIAATAERDAAQDSLAALYDLWLQAVEVHARAQLGQHKASTGQTVMVDGTGINYFLGVFNFGDLAHEHVLNSMTLFASQVAPAIVERQTSATPA